MYHCPGIQNYTGAETLTSDWKNAAFGSIAQLDFWWTDAGSVLQKAKITLVRLKCIAAISGSGIPVAMSYNATYGRGATGTYAAADLTAFFGWTISATAYTAGQMAWFQCAGPNYVTVGGTGAIASLAYVQHNTAGTTVKTITDQDNAIAKLTGVAMGGDGTIPIGDLFCVNRMGFT